jgi:tetratricopeptide (TPR) repeat protein
MSAQGYLPRVRWGEYEVVRPVGRGASGAVYEARDPAGRPVAVKVLLDASPETRARFARELRLLREVSTLGGFVPVLDAGETNGVPWIVMPFLRGGTLRARAQGVSLAEAVEVVRSLASTLARAHERGVVHRDLKPENVLFDETGRPLIADLGLAKHWTATGTSAALSASATFRGTAGYAAPEQLASAKHVGPQADVYALGAILYELLAGQHPFDEGTVVEVLARVAQGNFVPLAKRRPDLPAWVTDAVARCLATDPAGRPPDAGALERALAAPAAARRRGPLVPVALIATALALAAALAAAMRRPDAPPPPPPPAPDAEPRALVARAWRHLDARQAALARPDAERAVRLAPFAARAWRVLGAVHDAESRWGEAVVADTLAYLYEPRNAEPLAARSIARHALGDPAGALADVDLALALDPRLDAHAARSLFKLETLDATGAIADATVALESNPKDLLALRTRARSLAATGQTRASLADFDRAVELEPDDAVTLTNRGAARMNAGDLDGALADLDRSLELDAGLSFAYANRALARLRKDNTMGREALQDLDRALELDPENLLARETRALIRDPAGNLEGAYEDAGILVERQPGNAKYQRIRGELAAKLGREGEARAALDRALELNPADADAAQLRARLGEAKR